MYISQSLQAFGALVNCAEQRSPELGLTIAVPNPKVEKRLTSAQSTPSFVQPKA